MDNEQPYVEAQNDDDESDVRYFQIDEDSWVRKDAALPFIARQAIVQMNDDLLLVKHTRDLTGSDDHCYATFRLLDRREAARWYLLNGFDFPDGLARMENGRIVLEGSEAVLDATESDVPAWVSKGQGDAKIAVRDFLKELSVKELSALKLSDADVRDLLVVRVRCNDDFESIPDEPPVPEEWMKPAESRDFIVEHFGENILVEASKRPLESIEAAKRVRNDYTSAGIKKISKLLKG